MSKRLTKEEKIERAIKSPLLESTNKNYSKITHNNKVSYLSTDKKTGITKEMSAKQFRSLKKIVKIKEPTKNLILAGIRINKKSKGLRTERHIYKRFTDDKNRKMFVQIDRRTGELKKTIPFKKAIKQFKTYRADRDIRRLMKNKGLTRLEAKQEWINKQAYLKENQIQGIMKIDNVNRESAENKYLKLFNSGNMNTLIGKYTKFNPSSSYQFQRIV